MIKTLSIAAILLAFTCNTTDENQPTDEQLAEETTDEVVVEEIKKLSSEDADFLVFYQSFVSAVES
ncbi:MAG: hypothetical protein KJZ55_07945, partial [Flavobacteriales bacterium]|nr:hypothetical protein [Flavobacteriales bacterium]